MDSRRTNRRVVPVKPGDRKRLNDMLSRHGEAKTREMLGLSRHTLARIAAGLPVYPGTAALIRERLQAIEDGAGRGKPGDQTRADASPEREEEVDHDR